MRFEWCTAANAVAANLKAAFSHPGAAAAKAGPAALKSSGLLLVALVAFGGILRISIVLKWSAGGCQSVLICEARTLYVSFSP